MSDPPLDSATRVRSGEELDAAALSAFLASECPDLPVGGGLEIRQFPSGFSNLTYLVRLGDRELVLRRPPFGTEVGSAHDMGREYRVLSALAPTYPKAPAPLVFCADRDVLGAPFYLMERVEGVILRPGLEEEEAPEPGAMAEIADALVRTLVELHAVDPRAVGLGDLGRGEGYVARQLAGWTERYRVAKTDEVDEIEEAARWLTERQPSESGTALIHNDFKYDNLVLDPADPSRVIAVLDWEMATLGDPLMDLGTSLGYWVDPEDPPIMRQLRLSPTTLPGNPPRREIAERYAELSGRGIGDLVFYYVYGVFKIAVIIQQIYARYKQGHTRDERFASLIEGVRACGLIASRAIEKGRIDRLS